MITPATFFRDNTECFLVHNEKVLALKTDYGFIFPGGGVKSGETPIDAVKREILEETSLKISHAGFLESAYFVWPKDHIKTEKQKLRSVLFKGDCMHFFVAYVDAAQGVQGFSWFYISEVLESLSKEDSLYRKTQCKLLSRL